MDWGITGKPGIVKWYWNYSVDFERWGKCLPTMKISVSLGGFSRQTFGYHGDLTKPVTTPNGKHHSSNA